MDIPVWTLPDRLRKARQHAGLRQADIAPLLFVGRSTIAAWENGVHQPGELQLMRWSDVTDVPLPWIKYGIGGSPSPTGGTTDRYPLLPVLVAA